MGKFTANCFFTCFIILGSCYGDNQTPTVSPILPGNELPFTISLEKANFSLPQGLQSYVYAFHKDKVLLITGLTKGKHSFSTGRNTTVFVADLNSGAVFARSLLDPTSGLTQAQIDLLSVTNAQSIQSDNTLYITGGYGIDTSTGLFTTKNCLTAINIKKMIHWVTHPKSSKPIVPSIRQIFDDTFKVTGGTMGKGKNGLVLLMLGADFEGVITPTSQPIYTEQVRRFYIHDDGKDLSVSIKDPSPLSPDPNYRRRDLNIVPIIQKNGKHLHEAFVALSGVFTLSDGVWTVPVSISNKGKPTMANPNDPSTFKQGMNNYECASAQLFSQKTEDMYVCLFGGISYGYFQDGVFIEDPALSFINQSTSIKIDKHGAFTQYFIDAEYPFIPSIGIHPGNQLLFGADAKFFPAPSMPLFPNHVLSLDELPKKSKLIGYIAGGIQSTLGETTTRDDSEASLYFFKVFLKQRRCP